MTVLNRTELTLPQKIQCAAQALARQAHGAITALSLEFGISRPTVYEAGASAEAVLREHFEQGALGAVTLRVDQAQLRRAVVGLRVSAPNSIRAIEQLIPILYPGHHVSYGTAQAWLVEAQSQAKAFNASVGLAPISDSALDELFSQGDPVLAGLDLDSGYLFNLAVRDSRSGQDWAQVLGEAQRQGLALNVVVKDAAKGIAAGVSEVFPDAEQRDDCFHALYELGKVRQRLERQAYAAIEHEQQAFDKLRRTRARESKQRRKLTHKHVWAQRKCRALIADFDALEAAQRQLQAALSWIDLDSGQWRRGEQVREGVERAAENLRAIDRPGCSKVANYLTNRAPGLALYAAQLDTQLHALSQRYDTDSVSLAAAITQLIDDLKQNRTPWQRHQQQFHLLGAYQLLMRRQGNQADALLEQVRQLWLQRHRASSAVEGFNAALRPFLYVHKGVTQGFLELYRAYFNLRNRRWGRHRGTSAYQLLTGQPVDDWLTLLGFPPSPAVS